MQEDSEARVLYAGELLMFGFHEKDAGSLVARLRREGAPGGIIYFSRNAGSPTEIREMNRQIQAALADPTVPSTPMLIAVDQEGGTVARLTQGFSVFPSNMAFGAVYSAAPQRGTDLCFKAALATARELRDVGFNMNLAPCVDVNTNPENPVIGTRSYSDRPEVVAALGTAAIQGMTEGGVLAVAKHFPGHGDTSVDSHTGLPVQDWDDKYAATHLEPFRHAVRAKVRAIMAAHVGFRQVKEFQGPVPLPATLSHNVLTGLLRNQMGHSGLIVTDCMEMGAIASTYGTRRAAEMAVQAGADIVLVSHTPELQREAMNALLYGPGPSDTRILDRAVKRVFRAKSQVAAWRPDPAAPGLPPHDTLVRETARASITLLRRTFDPAHLGGPPLVAVPFRYGSTMALEPGESPVAMAVRRKMPGAQVELYSASPSVGEVERLSEKARRSPWVLFAASDMQLNSGQATLAKAMFEANPAFVLLDIATPYSVLALPAAPYVVCSYGYAPCQLAAALDVVTGACGPEGRLPVDVPGRFCFGSGLKG